MHPGSSKPWAAGPGGGPARAALRGWTGKGHRSSAAPPGGFWDAVIRDGHTTTLAELLFGALQQ